MKIEQLILPKFSRVRGAKNLPSFAPCHDYVVVEGHRYHCQRPGGHIGMHQHYVKGTAEPDHEWTTTSP